MGLMETMKPLFQDLVHSVIYGSKNNFGSNAAITFFLSLVSSVQFFSIMLMMVQLVAFRLQFNSSIKYLMKSEHVNSATGDTRPFAKA